MDEILNIEEDFKQEIENLWNNPSFSEIEVTLRGYGLHEKIIKNSILFIGINPSFAKNSNPKPDKYFLPLNQDAKTSDNGNVYTYFKRFVDITNTINKEDITPKVNWSHMDLLFFRETKQAFIKNLKKEKLGREFIIEQLKISRQIILKSCPKLIVVSNTQARDFMKPLKKEHISMNFEFEFRDEFGTYVITNEPVLKNVPIFFTSMLTGQRALDNGSYERLIWHIKLVLKKLN